MRKQPTVAALKRTIAARDEQITRLQGELYGVRTNAHALAEGIRRLDRQLVQCQAVLANVQRAVNTPILTERPAVNDVASAMSRAGLDPTKPYAE